MLGIHPILSGVLLILTTPLLSARVLLDDPFDYPDGPLVTVSSGRWKTHSGTAGQIPVTSRRIVLSQRQTEDVNATFPAGTVSATNAAAVFASFRCTFTALPNGASGAYFAHFKDTAATTGFRCRIFAGTNGAAAGCYRIGIAAGTNAASAILAQDLRLQQAYLIVCRMTLQNSGSTVWVNPRTEASVGATASDPVTPKPVAALAFRQASSSAGSTGEAAIDDVLVATTFAEVLRVNAPAIKTHPSSQAVPEGSQVQLHAAASGTPPLLFQWLRNGVEISDAANPDLVISNISRDAAGSYTVRVTNDFGVAESEPAVLTVSAAELRISLVCDGSSATLRWTASPVETYSIWAADALEARLSLLAAGLWYPDGEGRFDEAAQRPTARFFQVSTP